MYIECFNVHWNEYEINVLFKIKFASQLRSLSWMQAEGIIKLLG